MCQIRLDAKRSLKRFIMNRSYFAQTETHNERPPLFLLASGLQTFMYLPHEGDKRSFINCSEQNVTCTVMTGKKRPDLDVLPLAADAL